MTRLEHALAATLLRILGFFFDRHTDVMFVFRKPPPERASDRRSTRQQGAGIVDAELVPCDEVRVAQPSSGVSAVR